MSEVSVYVYQVGFSIAITVIISLGLAVIFGMMRVINLAHGEFMMLGAYWCAACVQAGIPFVLAVITSGAFVAAVGLAVERIMIRFLYERIEDTLLATWGLSLLLTGLVTACMGPQSLSIPVEIPNMRFGDAILPGYGALIIGAAVALLAAIYGLWKFTRFGIVVRATMQNRSVAYALGIDVNRIYMLTFCLGSALAGLAGAILAPIFGASPQMGSLYIARAFVTVIVGGGDAILGTASASTLFGAIDGVLSYTYAAVVGEVAVLCVALLLLRFLPRGISGAFRREF